MTRQHQPVEKNEELEKDSYKLWHAICSRIFHVFYIIL